MAAFAVTLGGVLTKQKTVNADGSYDIRVYTYRAGDVQRRGLRRRMTQPIRRVGECCPMPGPYYNAGGSVVASETFATNGGFAVTLGGVLYEAEDGQRRRQL